LDGALSARQRLNMELSAGVVGTIISTGISGAIDVQSNGGLIGSGLNAVKRISREQWSGLTTLPKQGSHALESALRAKGYSDVAAAISGKELYQVASAIQGLLEGQSPAEVVSALKTKPSTDMPGAIKIAAGDTILVAMSGKEMFYVEQASSLTGAVESAVQAAIQALEETTVTGGMRAFLHKFYDALSALDTLSNTDCMSYIRGCITLEMGLAFYANASAEYPSGIWGKQQALATHIYGALRGFLKVEIDVSSALYTLTDTAIPSAINGYLSSTLSAGIIGERPLESTYYDFNTKNMLDVSSVSDQADIFTVIKVNYAYDYSKGQHTKSLELEAPDVIKIMGRIIKEIDARWVQSPRQAYNLGVRYLQYYARSRWLTSFTTDFHAIRTVPGVWVNITHPHIPKDGRALILTHDINFDSAAIGIGFESLVGEVPRVVLSKMSAMFDPIADGITVTYANGKATIRILNEKGLPMVGATVTLDGTTKRITDNQGQVYYDASRGSHRIEVASPGYVPIDATIVF
jgi:hypothetical protein